MKVKAVEGRPRFCNFCDKQFYFEEPFQIHVKNVHKDGAQQGTTLPCHTQVIAKCQFSPSRLEVVLS